MIFYLVIALSSSLLFLVQPLVAKQILPWFGGSSAVWTTCMLFFQSALLLGYAYADAMPRWLGPRRQPRWHGVIALLCLLTLPIIAPESWRPEGGGEPISRVLLLLAVTIGAPYVLLSTNSPLIQSYFARTFPGRDPYRLFALSNAASLLALLAYPFLIEPFVGTRMQALSWSAAFAVFVLLLAWLSFRVSRETSQMQITAWVTARLAKRRMQAVAEPLTLGKQLHWLLLSMVASMLLLTVSNHITQNVASVPLLWIVPLSLYLLTFILTFDGRGWYWPKLYGIAFVIALAVMSWLLLDPRVEFNLIAQTAGFCLGLFVVCMVCHGELVRAKPAAEQLTRFYLLVSIGGALGGLIVSVLSPLLFPTYVELPLTLWLAALLFIAVAIRWHVLLGWAAIAGALAMATVGFFYVKYEFDNALSVTRNFYGTIKVKGYDLPASKNYLARMVHGAILHGEQYQNEQWRREPTTYYTISSGFGRAVHAQRISAPVTHSNQRIGMVGLGVGTVASWCREQDRCRIYEINPEVERLARKYFTYLEDSRAQIDVVLGDARLSLEAEAPNQFNVLAIDAFSGDSIPMHLITDEAVRSFMMQVSRNGILAYHVSNRFLELPPVLARIAEMEGLHGVVVEDLAQEDNALQTMSTWVLLARDPAILEKIDNADGAVKPMPDASKAPLWTDDFNNLWSVIKWR